MKAEDLKLNQLYRTNQLGNQSKLEKLFTIPTSAFGTLRQELFQTLGEERSKGFLLRYGWHCGVSDAEKVKKINWDNIQEAVLAGPKMHALHGHLDKSIITVNEVDIHNKTMNVQGIWINSVEAQKHLEMFEISKHPVCHTLTGYASGYLSTILNEKVIAIETKCKGMGDDTCYAVCRTVNEWNGMVDSQLKYYESESIIDELDEAFRILKQERDNLSKAYDVHQKLMKEVLQERDLTSIANVMHQMTKLPVLIDDIHLKPLVVAGFTHQENQFSYQQFHTSELDIRQTSFLKNRLIAPIYLGRKIFGYCSLIYEGVTEPQEVDKLILEHGVLACSLYLLNERTRFNTEQRIRGSFLDDILSNRITPLEISRRAYYVGISLAPPYFMISINGSYKKQPVKEKLEFEDELIEQISKFLKERKIDALMSQKSGSFIILLAENNLLQHQLDKNTLCQNLLDYCEKKYPQYSFCLGVSSNASINDVSRLYEESIASLKLTNQQQKIIHFESLGIEGVMFVMSDLEAIRNIVYKKLGNLIKEDSNKNMELTKTLYHYLANGCNVHKTARAINLSISGLRYRLQRINKLLKTDINIPHISHQLYLSLNYLIYMGDLEIND